MESMTSVQTGMDVRVWQLGPLSSSPWLEVCKAQSHAHPNYFLKTVNTVQDSGLVSYKYLNPPNYNFYYSKTFILLFQMRLDIIQSKTTTPQSNYFISGEQRNFATQSH